MATKKTQARIDIIADDKRFRQTLARMRKRTQQVSRDLEKMGSIAKGAFVAAAGAATGLIALYRTQEQAERKMAAAIKATGKEHEISLDFVRKFTSEIQDVTIYGDEATISAAALALQLGNLSKEQLPEATMAMANMAAGMKKDLATAGEIVAKALAAPARGLNQLARYGVEFTGVEKEKIKVMLESGKVMEVQTMMIDRLNEKFKGQAVAAAGGTGVLIQMAGALSDIGEAIGKHLFHWLEPLVKHVKDFARGVKSGAEELETLAYWIQKVTTFGAAMIAAVFTMKIVNVLWAFSFGLTAVGNSAKAAEIRFRAMWGALTLGVAVVIEDLISSLYRLRQETESIGDALTAYWLEKLNLWHEITQFIDSYIEAGARAIGLDDLADRAAESQRRAIESIKANNKELEALGIDTKSKHTATTEHKDVPAAVSMPTEVAGRCREIKARGGFGGKTPPDGGGY